MKKISFILFVFLYSFGFSKDNNQFIGFKISNGNTIFNYRYKYNGQKEHEKEKHYYLGAFLHYGGTIKNFSIYSGLGYQLYQFKYDNLVFDDDFNGTGFDPTRKAKRNYSIISIPINVDYNINLYKQKLFFVVGLGGELCITVKNKFKSTNHNITSDLSNQKTVSFAITARTGLLYDINKRFDIYAYFDFSHHATKYLPYKTEPFPGSSRFGNYPFNVAGSVGFNVKFYKKTKEEIPK